VVRHCRACTDEFTGIKSALQSEASPGASIAITRGPEVVYRRAFGIANTETGSLVIPDMLFRLGSTTKMFTAATLVSFAEQGRIDLNVPVSRYIAKLPACVGAVTAHQLLTHSAGIKDDAPMFGSHDDSALEANILSWRDDYCEDPPGKKYKYSNPSYVLAGYLSQVLSGKPFADTVTERILQPLGMTHSTFRPTMAMTYPLAEGHDAQLKIIRPAANYAGAWPAGSLFSNTTDLSKWVIAFLNGGPGLSPFVIKQLSTRNQPGSYGYGLAIRGEGESRILEHAGNRDGYGSFIRMYPAQRIGIIILGNRTGAAFPKTLRAVADAFSLAP